MALTPCSECGAEVSATAKTCPKCGVDRRRKTPTWIKVALPILLVGVVYAIAYAVHLNDQVDEQTERADRLNEQIREQ